MRRKVDVVAVFNEGVIHFIIATGATDKNYKMARAVADTDDNPFHWDKKIPEFFGKPVNKFDAELRFVKESDFHLAF